MNPQGHIVTHCTPEAHALLKAHAKAAKRTIHDVLSELLLTLPKPEIGPHDDLRRSHRALVELVEAEPGIAFQEACRRLGVGKKWCGEMLETVRDRVTAHRVHKRGLRGSPPMRLYPKGHPAVVNVPRSLAEHMIALSHAEPGISYRQIAERLGYHLNEVGRRGRALASEGRIEVRLTLPNPGKHGGPKAFAVYPGTGEPPAPAEPRPTPRERILEAIRRYPGSSLTAVSRLARTAFRWVQKVVRGLLLEGVVVNCGPRSGPGLGFALYLAGDALRPQQELAFATVGPPSGEPDTGLCAPQAPPIHRPAIAPSPARETRPVPGSKRPPNAPKPKAWKNTAAKSMPAESLEEWLAKGNKPTRCPGVGEEHPLPEPSNWKRMMHERLQAKKKARELAKARAQGESHAA